MLWITPYEFPNGSHAQEVPPILARLDPSLFNRDFAIQSFLGPSPRLIYQYLIVGLVRVGLAVPVAYFTVQLATLFASVAVLFSVARRLLHTNSVQVAALLALPLGFFLVAANTRGWNVPILAAGSAVPSTFAMPFALGGWYFSQRRRWSKALPCFGLAALLQVLVGLLPLLLLMPILVRDFRHVRAANARGLALGGLMFCLCVLAIVVPMRLTEHVAVPGAELIRIFGHVRAPHHWVPSTAERGFWLNQGLFWTAGMLLALLTPRSGQAGRARVVALVVVPMTAACIVLNYVGVELVPVAGIAKLQLQRTMPFAAVAILTLLAWHLAVQARAHHHGFVLAAILAPLAALHGVTMMLIVVALAARRRAPAMIVDVAALMMVLLIGLRGSSAGFANAPAIFAFVAVVFLGIVIFEAATVSLARWSAYAAVVVAATVTTATLRHPQPVGQPILDRFIRFGPALDREAEVTDTVRALARLVARHVPVDGLVLDPPVPALGFLPLLSRRSVVLTWGTTPYSDAGIAEWGARLDDLLGVRHESGMTTGRLEAEWRARSADQVMASARRYGATFVLTRDDWQDDLRATRIARESGWSLWAVPTPR